MPIVSLKRITPAPHYAEAPCLTYAIGRSFFHAHGSVSIYVTNLGPYSESDLRELARAECFTISRIYIPIAGSDDFYLADFEQHHAIA